VKTNSANESRKTIRKQMDVLFPQDMTDFPVWQFCVDEEGVDGQDECTIRPSVETDVSGRPGGDHLVAADVTLADGTLSAGFIFSGHPSSLGEISPIVLADSAIIPVIIGGPLFINDLQARMTRLSGYYKQLGKPGNRFFRCCFRPERRLMGDI